MEEITQRIIRKNTNLTSTLPLTISAQYGLVDQRIYFEKQIASKKLETYLLLKQGEFAYNKSYSKDYPFGTIKRLNNYPMGVLSTLYIAFKPTLTDTNFLEQYFDSSKWYKEIYKRATEGARNHGLLNISPLDFFEIIINQPKNKREQKKISKILKLISLLISLQQRKLKLLKAIKFYLLNQFLLNNNKWPKKKFGNLVNINRGLTYHPFDVVNSDGIRVLRSSNIKDSRIRFNKDDVFVRTSIVKEKYQLKKNDILVTAANGSSNLIGKHALMTKNIPNQVGGFMFSIETNEPHFIFACLESNWFKKLIHKSTTGGNGALGNLKGKDIKNAWIHIPERKIRERIGELEKNIDNFIDYNQKIVNKLIKFKQFLLQNMFI